MPAPPQRSSRTPADGDPVPGARGVDDFARSVHASYLSRWLRHDPAALEEAAEQEATKRKRRKRTSAA